MYKSLLSDDWEEGWFKGAQLAKYRQKQMDIWIGRERDKDRDGEGARDRDRDREREVGR